MEGAGGFITDLGDGWVRKTIKRSARGKRLSLADQQTLAAWAHTWVGRITAPAVRPSAVPHSYEMERVDTSREPWFFETVPDDMRYEVTAFCAAAPFRLWDCEFQPQADGRVVVLDWDQCRHKNGSV